MKYDGRTKKYIISDKEYKSFIRAITIGGVTMGERVSHVEGPVNFKRKVAGDVFGEYAENSDSFGQLVSFFNEILSKNLVTGGTRKKMEDHLLDKMGSTRPLYELSGLARSFKKYDFDTKKLKEAGINIVNSEDGFDRPHERTKEFKEFCTEFGIKPEDLKEDIWKLMGSKAGEEMSKPATYEDIKSGAETLEFLDQSTERVSRCLTESAGNLLKRGEYGLAKSVIIVLSEYDSSLKKEWRNILSTEKKWKIRKNARGIVKDFDRTFWKDLKAESLQTPVPSAYSSGISGRT